MPLTPGAQLGAYRIIDLIGVGGMGEVYRAEDTRLNRVVAIKVISAHLASQAQFQERFDREALTISQLKHPNVCTLHDVGHHDGADFLVMEYVEGETLAERLTRGPLAMAESLDVALQMARGLAHAHRLGIVHRDIKPANVMFADDGFVKLVDFGVAKSSVPGTITETGMAVGTLAYIAPEQLLPGEGAGAPSDVWGLGIVLYEMLTGVRPFQGRDVGSLMRSILHDGVPAMRIGGSARTDVAKLIKSALSKDPRDRPTAAEFGDQVAAYRTKISTATHPVSIATATRARWWIPAALATVVLIAAVIGVSMWNNSRRAAWARDVALPEIERLVAVDDYSAAYALALEAEQILGPHPALERLWPVLSVRASMTTIPEGAVVSVKQYADRNDDWRVLGPSPIQTRLPRGSLRFRIEHAGFETVYLARTLTAAFEPPPIALRKIGADGSTVEVPGDTLPVNLSGFNTEALVELPTFFIDRTEVTNRAFKEFVDAGGYDTPAFWSGGAGPRSSYVDATGRRGPATWEAGDFPSGRGDEPVGGVSWYEAAAYCAFRGQLLPTVYHWSRAALAPREVAEPLGPSIVPLSNFATQGPAPVGTFAGLGPYGTVDMAGNIREWTWNATAEGRRLILGGAWNDPDYMFSVPFSLPPDDRSAANGFRCMLASAPVGPSLLSPVDVSSADYREAKPVSEEAFQLFAKQFAYVPAAVAAPVESTETTPAGSIREQATIDVGYRGERMRVYVFLPPKGTPPYDAVIYFPALNAFQSKASSTSFYPADYVVKSGRALVLPVFKGSFERWDPSLGLTGEEYMRALRSRLTEWRQDLGRTIDYLATRSDINANRVAYYGRSFGASMPLALLALEPRITTAVLYSGGFTYRKLPAETDPVNYVSHVRIPVLMLNGRHDYVLPYETSQKPLFRLLGTPAADKRHIVYDAGHDPLPRNKFVAEILAWLERYLGSPR